MTFLAQPHGLTSPRPTNNWLQSKVKTFNLASDENTVESQCFCMDAMFFLHKSGKQCRDVTSRGVSGRLMRQSSDSGAAPERARKPPPSANYHLVRCIWQQNVQPHSAWQAERESTVYWHIRGTPRLRFHLKWQRDKCDTDGRTDKHFGFQLQWSHGPKPTCTESDNGTTTTTPLKHFPSLSLCFPVLDKLCCSHRHYLRWEL